MKKTAALIFALALALTACGYKIAGYDGKRPVRFYIERVVNDTIDSEFGDVVQSVADRYFIKYGEMASYKNATYFLQIRLENIDFYADITSATDEAVSTNAVLELQIIVTDANGVEVFSGNYKPSASFAVTSAISSSLSNRRAAIEENVETALEDFRNAFNSKML